MPTTFPSPCVSFLNNLIGEEMRLLSRLGRPRHAGFVASPEDAAFTIAKF
jgi:hypothetical protein